MRALLLALTITCCTLSAEEEESLEPTPTQAVIPSVTITQDAGESSNWVTGKVQLEGDFSQYNFNPDDYRLFRAANQPATATFWLLRFDYDGMTHYQLVPFDGSLLTGSQPTSITLPFTIPLRGSESVTARYAVFTGDDTKPIFRGEQQLPVKPLIPRELDTKARENLDSHLERWNEQDLDIAAAAERTNDPNSIASYAAHYQTWIAMKHSEYGYVYLMANQEELRAELKQRLERLGGLGKAVYQRFYLRSIGMYFELFFAGMLYPELDAEVSKLEDTFNLGDITTKERVAAVASNSLLKLGDYYARLKLDSEKGLHYYERTAKLREYTEAPVTTQMFLVHTIRADRARQFFPTEAFAEKEG